MSEEEVSAELLGDPLMLSERLPVVGCERVNTGRKRRQQGDLGIRDRLRRLLRHMGNQRIARSAFIECDERLLLSRANHQIALPVAEAGTFSHDGWAQIDGHLIGDRAASLATAITFPANLLATQRAMQRAAGALVGVDALIDGLVADAGLSINFKVARDLFRAPGLGKLDVNYRPSLGRNARAVLSGADASR